MTDLREQVDYYRARAGEYEQWFFRQGRYDRGQEFAREWFQEVERVRCALGEFRPEGTVLELAGGTGLWTKVLAEYASTLTVVDSSPEMIAINRERVAAFPVTYIEADLFEWSPDRLYDVVFFSFWLSHVPSARFEQFWRRVGEALAPAGRVFLIDSLDHPGYTWRDPGPEGEPPEIVRRELNDGREFHIVKIFYRPEQLAERLRGLGWNASLRASGQFFLYGSASRRA